MAKKDKRAPKSFVLKALKARGLTATRLQIEGERWWVVFRLETAEGKIVKVPTGEKFKELSEVWDAKCVDHAKAPHNIEIVADPEYTEEETGETFVGVDMGKEDVTVVEEIRPVLTEDFVEVKP